MERLVLSGFILGLVAVGVWVVYTILSNAFISVSDAITIAERVAG